MLIAWVSVLAVGFRQGSCCESCAVIHDISSDLHKPRYVLVILTSCWTALAAVIDSHSGHGGGYGSGLMLIVYTSLLGC